MNGDFLNETDGPVLTASTGKNDSSSVWGQGLLNAVTGLGNTVANVANAFKGTNNPTKVTPTTPTNLVQPGNNTMLYIIGGVVAVIALVLLLRK